MKPTLRPTPGATLWVGLAALLLAAPAAADMVQRSWKTLGQPAQTIVLGTVERVREAKEPGSIVAKVRVDETFRGPRARVVRVAGSRIDATQPNFVKGAHVVLFLGDDPMGEMDPRRGKAAGRGRGQPRHPIGGSAGVLVVPEEMLAGTVAFLSTLVAREADFGWTTLEPDFFESAPPVHPVLIGVSLASLSGRVSMDDEPDLMRAACNATGVWRQSVHLWAMGTAGRLQLPSTRKCLREKAAASDDFGEQVAAADALGDLGDPASADTLIPLLFPPAEADAGSDVLADTAALALGKLGLAEGVAPLLELALDGTDQLGLHGTAVHALAMIEGPSARKALREIARTHPNKLVRRQARQALRRLRGEA